MVKSAPPAEARDAQQRKFAECCMAFSAENGINLLEDNPLLEFGCGHGELLRQFSLLGVASARGFEIASNTQNLDDFNRLKVFDDIRLVQIPMIGYTPLRDYEIPYPDECFKFVCSNVVFEHVMTLELIARELSRITAPGGIHVHLFPGPFRLTEGHTGWLFAGFFHPLWYIRLYVLSPAYKKRWSNKHAGMSHLERSKAVQFYLTKNCNYPHRHTLRKVFSRYFTEVDFKDADFFSHWPGGMRKLARIMRFPPLAFLHNVFRMRVLYLKK